MRKISMVTAGRERHVGIRQKVLLFFCGGMLIFLGGADKLQAETLNQWNMEGGGVITDGTVDYSRTYCGGEDGYTKVLTEGSYTAHHWCDYAYCPNNYDLYANITFPVPPSSIIGDEAINLKANGTMTGTRDCCFINDWFKYSVSCEDGAGYSITADDDEKKVIDLWGSSGTTVNYSDDLDIQLTLPGMTSSATKCIITAYASSGGSIQWTYYPTYVEVADPPNTFIKGVEYDYDIAKDEIILLLALGNTGGPDSGTIEVDGDIYYYRQTDQAYIAKGFIATSSTYTLGENGERVISIHLPVNYTQGDTSVKFSQACDEYTRGLLWAPDLTIRVHSETGGFTRSKAKTFTRFCYELHRVTVIDMILGPLSVIHGKGEK